MKFRKNFTPEEYERYLAEMAKTSKYEHDGLESWEVDEGVKEGQKVSSALRRRNERTCKSFGQYNSEWMHCPYCVIRVSCRNQKELIAMKEGGETKK